MLRTSSTLLGCCLAKSSARLSFPVLRCYTPHEIQLREEKSGYYINPNDAARRLIKLFALHDKVKKADQLTLLSTWSQHEIDPLTYTEIMLEAELEFDLEIADEDLERFETIKDVVEHVSRSFFAK